MPSTAQDLSVSAQTFRRMQNFPRVIGALDCTHFAIKGQSVDENIYVNRKRYHSMNVQVVCDAAKLIISFCARFPGVFTSREVRFSIHPSNVARSLHLVFCCTTAVSGVEFQNLSSWKMMINPTCPCAWTC
ncbi:putative nuclease HARBI1 [Chionoecetes opilio]|uniref:Putative nuclease HARBI1 n=1 Tax=Chionoecetes opilio TaxID=41210 RepID=A0A8J4XXJ1_CHIOP|nr:putative nuclease HARBI1 [Chionoecetes opilio]